MKFHSQRNAKVRFLFLAQSDESSCSSLLPSPELSDMKDSEPGIRALLGTAAHFCEVLVRGVLADCSEVDEPGEWYKSVNFRVGESLVSPNR
jgi:hypothetical protein